MSWLLSGSRDTANSVREPFMNKVKAHFEAEAKKYNRIILNLIPFYRTMLEALLFSLPFPSGKTIDVIDLGSGTGNIALAVKKKFPRSRLTCLDLAENMLEISKARMKRLKAVEFIRGDLSRFPLDKKYDAVLSSLAIHHLRNDPDKYGLYRRIFSALKKGGVFYNADVVLGPDAHWQLVYMKQWISFMARSVPKSEIKKNWLVKYRAEDRPAVLMNQLKWLEKIGFKKTEVVWKYYNFAVYGGTKE